MNRAGILRAFVKLLPGMAAMVLLAAGLGLAFNSLNPKGLQLVRKPLKETRAFAPISQILASVPKPAAEPAARKLLSQPEKPKIEAAPPVKVNPTTLAPAPKPAKAPAKPKKVQALFTTLADAKALFDNKSAIFIDGRLEVDYDAEHIAGALSLFGEEIDKLHDKVLGNVPKDRLIVTYCSDPECTEAINLADALVARGHTRVVILLEGLPGWKDAGYPTEGKGGE